MRQTPPAEDILDGIITILTFVTGVVIVSVCTILFGLYLLTQLSGPSRRLRSYIRKSRRQQS